MHNIVLLLLVAWVIILKKPNLISFIIYLQIFRLFRQLKDSVKMMILTMILADTVIVTILVSVQSMRIRMVLQTVVSNNWFQVTFIYIDNITKQMLIEITLK